VQLSAQFVRIAIEEAPNGSNRADKPAYVNWHSECFDMYVNPGDRAIWMTIPQLCMVSEPQMIASKMQKISEMFGPSSFFGSALLLLMSLL
jgi:hypothetical protein